MLEWIQTHSSSVIEAFRQGLYMLLGFGILRNLQGEPWTDAQVGLVLAFASAIGALITAKTTVSASKVQRRVETARREGFAEGTGSGDEPPRPFRGGEK